MQLSAHKNQSLDQKTGAIIYCGPNCRGQWPETQAKPKPAKQGIDHIDQTNDDESSTGLKIT